MKGNVRRSEESLISFFAGPVLNKYWIVKTCVLESYLTLYKHEFFRVDQAMRASSHCFFIF